MIYTEVEKKELDEVQRVFASTQKLKKRNLMKSSGCLQNIFGSARIMNCYGRIVYTFSRLPQRQKTTEAKQHTPAEMPDLFSADV